MAPRGAGVERRLTEEQLAAVNLDIAFGTPQRIRLIAYAGTGKTTTMAQIALRHSDKRVLYLVRIITLLLFLGKWEGGVGWAWALYVYIS